MGRVAEPSPKTRGPCAGAQPFTPQRVGFCLFESQAPLTFFAYTPTGYESAFIRVNPRPISLRCEVFELAPAAFERPHAPPRAFEYHPVNIIDNCYLLC